MIECKEKKNSFLSISETLPAARGNVDQMFLHDYGQNEGGGGGGGAGAGGGGEEGERGVHPLHSSSHTPQMGPFLSLSLKELQ